MSILLRGDGDDISALMYGIENYKSLCDSESDGSCPNLNPRYQLLSADDLLHIISSNKLTVCDI